MTRLARTPLLLSLAGALLGAVPTTASAAAISVTDAPGGIAVGVPRVQGDGAAVLFDGRLIGSLDAAGSVRIGDDLIRGKRHVVTVRSAARNRTSVTRLAAAAPIVQRAGRAAALAEAPPSVTTDRAARWSFAVPVGTRAFCTIDRAAVRACSGGSFSTSGLALGTHTFTLELKDQAGARAATRAVRATRKTGSTTQTWTVVSPPPTITVKTAPAATTTSTTASLAWSVSDRKATSTCTLDGATYADCDGTTSLSRLAVGDHAFAITAKNGGGTATQTIAWKVTAAAPPPAPAAPDDQRDVGPAGHHDEHGRDPRLDGLRRRRDEDVHARRHGLRGLRRRDGLAGLAVADHAFAITARNTGGTTTQTIAWKVTAPAPTPTSIALTAKPLAQTASTSASLAWTTGGTITDVTCAVDGAAAAACTSPLGLSELAKGAHTVSVTATGPEGSATATANWTIVTRSIMWGAYVNGQQYGFQNPPWDMRGLDRFESYAGGKQVSILHFGQPWYVGGVAQKFYNGPLDAVRNRGAIPLVDWNSWDLRDSGTATQPTFTLGSIIDGTHDAYIRLWATGARDWGHPFFLRFDHEMNGDWYPWSEKRNGNTAGQYVAAWRHVHDIFEQVGATNVTWVWAPNTEYTGSIALEGLYPGDAYVDWVAIDGYNWGTNPKKPAGWKTFSQVFGPTYDHLGRLAPTKPVMLSEFATSEYGGSKAAWIKDALEVQIPDVFTRIQAVAWFNWEPEGIDWNVESSATSAAAFAAGIGLPAYTGAQFGSLGGGRIQPSRAERAHHGPASALSRRRAVRLPAPSRRAGSAARGPRRAGRPPPLRGRAARRRPT